MAKIKFTIEYAMGHTSASRLWGFLHNVPGLEAWFADRVEQDGKHYVFYWGDAMQEAALVSMRRDVYVRFHWVDDEERTFFEIRIGHSELTDETSLTITDFADDKDDAAELTELWNQQVDNLKRNIGIN